MTPWPADGGPLCYVRSYASTAGALGSHTCWKHSSFPCQSKVYKSTVVLKNSFEDSEKPIVDYYNDQTER